MKNPRLTDFDPNAKVPELASPLDGYPIIGKPNRNGPKAAVSKTAPVEPVTDTEKEAQVNNGITQPSSHETMKPRYRDTTGTEMIETIRKAVRELGEKAATHRFTREEKEALADIEYAYRKQYSWQTSENELTRIAIHWLIEDYQANGENSILHKVLKALKS